MMVDAHAGYTANINNKVVMPYANMDTKTTMLINHKRDYAKASYTELEAGLRADYSIPGSSYGLFARISGGTILCSIGTNQIDLHASIGITF